jgi:hypothetical protein
VLYRVTLAVLLDHTGRRDEACDLLREIDPSTVHCRSCLQRAMAIFQDAQDWQRFEAFRARSDEVPEPRREDV